MTSRPEQTGGLSKASPLEQVSYIEPLLGELQAIAASGKHIELARLLADAHAEAKKLKAALAKR